MVIMLISVEHEMPAVSLRNKDAVPPEVFDDLWGKLATEGWVREGDHAVSRKLLNPSPEARKPEQMLTTDTGPTIEIAPSPAETVQEIEHQLTALRGLVVTKLRSKGVGLLGSGIHPFLGSSLEEYSRYRTPRMAYDYAIRERGWQHRSLLNIAAMQEVIDVPIDLAPRIVATMHRLAGVVLFLFRNDSKDIWTNIQLSVRPLSWRNQTANTPEKFKNDRLKVCLPCEETNTWQEYLRLLWERNPMFLLGTKNDGLVFVPEHPDFATFVSSPPKEGWVAKRLDSGQLTRISPTMEHVAQTDWTYMGFARLRLFWKAETPLKTLVEAYQIGGEHLNAFLREHLEKVLLENRSTASPPPGEETCSLAFILGLVENFEAMEQFVKQKPYSFWLELARAAEKQPLSFNIGGVEVADLIDKILALSRTGLVRRGHGEERYLEPLARRVRERESPAERFYALGTHRDQDVLFKHLLYVS